MPLIKVQVSEAIESSVQDELMKTLSREIVGIIGKPESYMMVTFEKTAVMMGGTDAPAAFIEIRSIGGLTPEVNRNISDKLGSILQSKLNIPSERIYINFTDIARTHWGWNRSTFG